MTMSFLSGSDSVVLACCPKMDPVFLFLLLQEAILEPVPVSQRHEPPQFVTFPVSHILRVRSSSTIHEFVTMSSFSGSDSVVLSCCPKRNPMFLSSPPGNDPGTFSSVPNVRTATVCYVPCLAQDTYLASLLFIHTA